MPLAVLHPGEGTKDTVAPLLLIVELAVDECIRLVDEALLHHLPPGEDAIGDIHILGRGAHLQRHWCTIVGEAGVRAIEPVVGLFHGYLVIEREEGEITLEGIFITDGLQMIQS